MEHRKKAPVRRVIAGVLILCGLASLLVSALGASGIGWTGVSAAPAMVSVNPTSITVGGLAAISGPVLAQGRHTASTADRGVRQLETAGSTMQAPIQAAVDTLTPTATATNTATPSATDTASPIASNTAIPTATNTATPSATDTASPTASNTAIPTATNTAVIVSVNPTSITAGGVVSIAGSGFVPGEQISLHLTASTPQAGLPLGTATADGTGNFSIVNAPISASQPAGSYLIIATGVFSTRQATTPLHVTAPQVAVAVSVNPGNIAAGGHVTIAGSGFLPGEQISLTAGAPQSGVQLATVTADGAGNFSSVNLTIPASQLAGNFLIVATGLTSQRQATTPLHVTAPQVAVTVSVNPSSIAAGGQVAIAGSGFVPGEPIYLTLTAYATALSGLPLGTATADGAGNFSSVTTTIPVTTPNGSYLVLASGGASGRSATTGLQVTAPQAAIAVNPTTFAPTSSVSVSGSGFAANERVTVSLNAANGTGSIVVGQVQADGSGNVAATSLQVPFGVAAGAWQLSATGQSSNRQATVGVTVNALAATLAVNPNSVLPGASLALSGAHFQPGESVVVSLVGLTTTATIATAQADNLGAFSIGSATIPLSAAQGAATLVATGNTSRLSANAQITIGANPVTLTLSTGGVAAGGAVGATGSGFAPGETVTVQLHRSTAASLNVGTIVANASGGFTITAVPIARYLNGAYTVSAYGQSSGRAANATLAIQGAPRAQAILSIVGSLSNQASPGGLVQVAGGNFRADASVTLTLAGSGVTTSLGTVTADAGGNFGPDGFTIPVTVPPGSYSVQARISGTVIATATLQVLALSPTFSIGVQTLIPGQAISVNGSGYAAGEQVVLALNGDALATTPATVLTGSNNGFSAHFVVPATINNGANTITATGASSHASFALHVPGTLPGAATAFYFPNGDTTNGNRTVIAVLNPTDAAAALKLTFLYAGAPERTVQQTLPARRQVLIDLNLVAGTNRHVATIVRADRQIVAGSTLYYRGADSAASLGASAPATTWYLAEGYTGGSFHEFLQIMNPNTTYANVDVRFVPSNGRPPQEHRLSLRGRSTISLDTSIYMPRASFSTIVTSDQGVVVERSMRFGTKGRGATGGKGVTAASTVWLFAGGVSAADRQTFLSILNPNQASPAIVTAAFYDSTGKPVGNRTITVNPLNRGTIKLNDVLPNASVAMVVSSTVPVVVERPLYVGPANLDSATDGVNVFGRNGGDTAWLFPSGDSTGGNQVTFQIFNSSPKTNEIAATFYTSTGTVIEKRVAVPANGDTQLSVNGIGGLATGTFGTMLKSTNGQPFVAERRTTNTALGTLDGTQGLAQ